MESGVLERFVVLDFLLYVRSLVSFKKLWSLVSTLTSPRRILSNSEMASKTCIYGNVQYDGVNIVMFSLTILLVLPIVIIIIIMFV